MDCGQIDRNEVAEKYLNGQLDEATQDAFEIHILECGKCLQAVELLQAVRFDLNENAHELRTQTTHSRNWFRWQWIAAACSFVIVGSVGLLKLGQLHRAHQPAAAAYTEAAANRNSASAPPQTASNSPPSNGQMTRDNAPTTGSPPLSDLKISGMRARSNQVHVGQRSTTTNTVAGKDSPPSDQSKPANPGMSVPVVADSNPAGAEGKASSSQERIAAATPEAANQGASSGQVSDELSQLAAVRALPYTFSGVASSQPSGGGSVRLKHEPASGISGNLGTNPHPGTSGFETAQDLFQTAMTAYVEGRYGSAADLLGQAVELDPQFAEGNLYLGICNLMQGKAGDAVPSLQSASRDKKPTVAQAAHFYLAKAYLQTGNLEEAGAELHAAAAIPGRLTAEASAMIPRLQAIRRAAEIKK